MYKAETFFIVKLRKFPFETNRVLNKSIKFREKKNDRKVLKKNSVLVPSLVVTRIRKCFSLEISIPFIFLC